jgi:parallel beta-helix repeat protein
MRRSLVLIAVGALVAPQVAGAATCPDLAPGPITAAAAASIKCQDAIAKAGAKYIGAKLKTLAKCRLSQPAGTCPTAADVAKIDKAAASAVAGIAKACGTDAAQAGLSSSYGGGTDDGVISSCTLSQNSVSADLVVAESHGASVEAWPGSGTARANCLKELSKSATKMFTGALKAAGKCLSSQTKAQAAGDLSPVCLGSFSGGAFVPPTDLKTATAQNKLITKTEAAVAKKCGTLSAGDVASIFAYAGATSLADLQNGVVCGGMRGTFDALVAQYGETGTFVAPGVGAIQAAVTAASAGDKLLIGSGTYQEEVVVATPGLSLVGCGAGSSNPGRPLIVPPSPEVTGRGIQSVNQDDLLFQSLAFDNQNSDHLFNAGSTNLTYRDIVGNGQENTRYAVFPVNGNNVLVELCDVERQDDAPIYVGQSSGIVVRYNRVRNGVAGIEIENSGSAQVYGNVGTSNTAGILVFKDGSLPVQLAECHTVHHNVFENNNTPNFGSGTVAGVPTGSGVLVISSDKTPYSYNFIRGNNTGGHIVLDQVISDFGPPFSADQSVDSNYVFNNVVTGNGTSPDPDRWQLGGNPLPGADMIFLATEASGNCQGGNVFNTQLGIASYATPCTLPVPAFPGCPTPPIP